VQCKDIPTQSVLNHLAEWGGIGCNWYSSSEPGWGDNPRSVRRAMPAGTPEYLVHAKMRQLYFKRTIDGCVCGCRGDFELTAKGWLLVSDAFKHYQHESEEHRRARVFAHLDRDRK